MVSEKNTKQEIWAYYQNALKEAKGRKTVLPDELSGISYRSNKADLLMGCNLLEQVLRDRQKTKSEEKEKQMTLSFEPPAAAVIKAEEKPVEKNLPEEQEAVKTEKKTREESRLSEEDSDLKLLNNEIIDKIQALEDAKAMKAKENEMLKELETELERFIALLNQSREKMLEQQRTHEQSLSEETEKRDAMLFNAKQETDARIQAAEQKLADTKAELKLMLDKRNADRKIEKEQYEYDLSVLHKKEDDAWEDELSKREAGIRLLESDIGILEKEITEKEVLVSEYRKKLEELPSLLEKAKEEGAAQKEKELNEELLHKRTMTQKDAEAEIKSLEQRIQTLREDYAAVIEERNAVQIKLDKAYDESNKLYLQTIQSTGGIKILNNFDKK